MGIFTLANAPIKKTYKTWYEKSISAFCESAEGLTLLGLCNAASGLDYSSLEPYIVRDEIGMFNVCGVNNTTVTYSKYPIHGVTGTATARANSTDSYRRLDKIGYVSTTGAGAFAAIRSSSFSATVGSGSVGGFTTIKRFACADAAPVTGARQLISMQNSVTPANVEPSTVTNVLGVGNGAADTNLKIFYGGSAAQTPIDLGANFPANTTYPGDLYEIAFFSFKWLNNKVGYQLKRPLTGHVARGILSAATPGVELPLSTTFLAIDNNWRCNNADTPAVALDFFALMRGIPNDGFI